MDSDFNLPVVLISIHPHYAEAILSGTKEVELRRVAIREPFQFLALYATAPTKAIVGFCRVSRVVSASPTRIWEEFGKVSGVTRRVFREYYRGCNIGHAIVIADVSRCEPPLALGALGIGERAPQSFAYIPGLSVQQRVLQLQA